MENDRPARSRRVNKYSRELKIELTRPAYNVERTPQGIRTLEQLFNNDGLNSEACYLSDGVSYLKHLERRRRISLNFLISPNATVSPNMRAVLIDWLIEVQYYFSLHQETLYLTVEIIDHFFDSRSPITMNTLQLLVIAALFVACKVSERFAPRVKKLLHLTEDSYKDSEVMLMERRVLMVMNFNLNFATPGQFVDVCLRASGANEQIYSILSYYLIDLILPDCKSTRFLSSLKAAAATYLAVRILDQTPGKERIIYWGREVEWHSGYNEHALQPVVSLMIQTLIELPNSDYQGARKKYSSTSRFQSISKMDELHPDALKSLVLDLPWKMEGHQPTNVESHSKPSSEVATSKEKKLRKKF